MLRIVRSEETSQTAVVTGSKRNKLGQSVTIQDVKPAGISGRRGSI
jgi:hypothetical protein